ncbi:hypothetical protein [Paenibacillus sp. MMS18-CY102]|uniref:hypothetical protein n=1 Tax=Paenibacillus sp. MMS18-CY102 TaxID=2682849 RepID=UPI0013654D04|nr:hypothetical protein [Paenibacillus sp. MMS18-CY102]
MSDPINRLFKSLTPTAQQKERMLLEIKKRSIEDQKPAFSHKRRRGGWVKYLTAAVLVVILSVFTLSYINEEDTAFALYVYNTGTELTSSGVEIATGIINDNHSMRGELVQFNVKGNNINSIRFSIQNQYMDFTDWTETRSNYSMEKQFTVVYGSHASEYSSLVVNWNPKLTIQALNSHPDRTIASLNEQLRTDRIVMEITYSTGTKATKALDMAIQEDGKIFAKLRDYVVTEKDQFVLNPQVKPTEPAKLPDNRYEPSNDHAKYSKIEIDAAAKLAQEYYAKFPEDRQIVKISYTENVQLLSSYIQDEYKAWQIITFDAYEKSMYPNTARHIFIAREDATKEWTVINEGY